MSITQFLLDNIAEVFFFYGLSFFSMGLAISLEVGHSSELDFSKALKPLAGFGIIHGSHEWFEMILLNHPEITSDPSNAWISFLRITLLAVSFLLLVAFGARLIAGPGQPNLNYGILVAAIILWFAGLIGVMNTIPDYSQRMVAADVYTRYSLAIPGAALTAWGLILQRRKFIQAGLQSFGYDVVVAAIAFGLYGGIGQLFASPSAVFPSYFLNNEVFVRLFGFPVQVLRAIMACVAAIFIIRSLRSFEVENHRRLEALRDSQMAERSRLEAVKEELLHRTVKAQESERKRIAHELHDETGQTLTALGIGLRGLSETIQANPEKAIHQASRLEQLAVSGLVELQHMVSGLHPSQLDDFGLIPALRWYANEVQNRYNLKVNVISSGDEPELSSDERMVLFRIAQEAINNVVRHANADQTNIELSTSADAVTLSIQDDGEGFDVISTITRDQRHPSWGIWGMQERAALVGGNCEITSKPGQGTRVIVTLRRER